MNFSSIELRKDEATAYQATTLIRRWTNKNPFYLPSLSDVDAFVSETEKQNLSNFGVRDGEDLIAFGSLSRMQRRPTENILLNIVVDSERRREGNGRRLVDGIEGVAREQGVEWMYLYATEEGFPLYQTLGYLDTGMRFSKGAAMVKALSARALVSQCVQVKPSA